MVEIIRREFIYVWYYFDIQLRQILPYWVIGIIVGSAISVFAKEKIHGLMGKLGRRKGSMFALIPASLLGIASPLCMYGTIPLAASLKRVGMQDDLLAAFMMSSILLNLQLLIYSAALGTSVLLIRFLSCFLCGILAGLLVRLCYHGKAFFDFSSFGDPANRDTDPNLIVRLLKNIGKNLKATGVWFLLGVLLSALFQRYVPAEQFAELFGREREGFGILMAATIGVPLYACGGGTIPLLQQWLSSGMSIGAAAAFMVTGPATKITNLGALKIVFGLRRFLVYLVFVACSALFCGLLAEVIVSAGF